MRLEEVLKEDYILPDIKAREKRDLLEEMVAGLVEKENELNRDELLEVLLEREQLGSTGIGYGVAIPHGKVSGLGNILVTFGRSKRGVDFEATDERPVHLFFMIFAPEDSTAAHLKVLSSISGILKDASFRKRLMKASDSEDIYKAIIEADRDR